MARRGSFGRSGGIGRNARGRGLFIPMPVEVGLPVGGRGTTVELGLFDCELV